MRTRFAPIIAAAVPMLLIAACSSNTEKIESKASLSQAKSTQGASPSSAKGHAAAEAGSAVSLNNLTWDVPPGFEAQEPSNPMRMAQYRIPAGKPETRDGELAIFFFGEGGGGETQANLERWAGQFKQEDGGDPMRKAALDSWRTAAGLKISTIDLSGRYETAMMGAPSMNESGWRLYGAVVEGPGGPWFLKAVGPDDLIASSRPVLRALLEGLRGGE